jgi:drug/metabolite transporter (DMT)-like permease
VANAGEREPMSGTPASKGGNTLLGRIALGVLGLFLLGFYVAFGRLLAGSWRQFAVLVLVAATYLGGMILLTRVTRPRSAAEWRRISLVFPVLGAAAGGVYLLASTVSRIGPVVAGVVWGLLHAWLVRRQTRTLAGA